MVLGEKQMQDTQKPNQTPTGAGNFSNVPKPEGAGMSEKKQVRPEDLISFGTNDESVTSTFTVSRLFSLRQKKWIKPHHTEVYGLDYLILPGRYILITAHVHKRKDEVMRWSIKLIRVYRDENGEVKEEVEKESEWITPINESERTIPILRDIENPGFHGHSRVPLDKQYTDEEVSQLLEGGVDPALGEEIQ
jgi:hypothetical protein